MISYQYKCAFMHVGAEDRSVLLRINQCKVGKWAEDGSTQSSEKQLDFIEGLRLFGGTDLLRRYYSHLV